MKSSKPSNDTEGGFQNHDDMNLPIDNILDETAVEQSPEAEPSEVLEDETISVDQATAGDRQGTRDLIAVFSADVSQVDLLTREQEESLGLEIAIHRERIRGWLRARPRLVREALEGLGRGVVHPEEDFREREALIVLNYARGKLKRLSRRQRGRKTLGRFVADLER